MFSAWESARLKQLRIDQISLSVVIIWDCERAEALKSLVMSQGRCGDESGKLW